MNDDDDEYVYAGKSEKFIAFAQPMKIIDRLEESRSYSRALREEVLCPPSSCVEQLDPKPDCFADLAHVQPGRRRRMLGGRSRSTGKSSGVSLFTA